MGWNLFFPLLATIVVAVLGWWVGHHLTARRDLINERRKLRLEYLLEAYRRLESAAHRLNMTPEQRLAFEAAVADIQLLGTREQEQAVIKFAEQHVTEGGASIDDVLRVLREDLRQEMGLSGEFEKGLVFRFTDGR